MILVGIDDTDTLESEGTNQLARRLAARLPAGFRVEFVLRHQLLFDRRIPYTSHNGSASLLVRAEAEDASREAVSTLEADMRAQAPNELVAAIEAEMRAWFKEGSDPGLCIAADVPAAVQIWGRRCQREVVAQDEARDLAASHGLYLRGLGGTEGGVIGALAAVGLLAAGDDGRVVHMAGWPWPDPLRGVQPLSAVRARGIANIRERATGKPVAAGSVDLGKHLRPAWRGGKPVLFVERAADAAADWTALKLP